MANLINSSVDINLPIQPLTKDPALFEELSIVYNAIRNLQSKLSDYLNGTSSLPFEGGAAVPGYTLTSGSLNRFNVRAIEDLAYGDLVQLYPYAVYNTGTATWHYELRARKAFANYEVYGTGTSSYLYYTYGTLYASQSVPRKCDAICNSIDGILTGALGECIIGNGVSLAIAGIQPGAYYYLTPYYTSGSITYGARGKLQPFKPTHADVVLSGAGTIFTQYIGVGVEENVLYFNPSDNEIVTL